MTPLQRRQLQVFREFRYQPMTVRSLVLVNWRRYLVTLTPPAVGLVYFCLVYNILPPGYGAIGIAVVLGMLVGLLSRDLGTLRGSAANWPVVREVIDWEKVDQRLAEVQPDDGLTRNGTG